MSLAVSVLPAPAQEPGMRWPISRREWEAVPRAEAQLDLLLVGVGRTEESIRADDYYYYYYYTKGLRELSEILSSMQPRVQDTVASSQSMLSVSVRTRDQALYFYVHKCLLDISTHPPHQIVATFHFIVQFKMSIF